MYLHVLALLPSFALSSPPPSTHRIAAILVPMDKGAESAVVKIETYLDEALEGFGANSVRKTDDLLGLPEDEGATESLERAEKGYKESRSAFHAKDYDDAERKLRATIKEFKKAAGAMKGCGDLCDAMAMYAATLQSRGDVEEAKLTLTDVMAMHPTFEFDPKRYGRDLLSLRTQVATSHWSALRGNLTVKSRPQGARVYVDGEFSGYTPLVLSTMSVGKHLVRVERPGFKIHGEIVDVTPEDQQVQADLSGTSSQKAVEGQLDKVAAEVLHEKSPNAIVALAKSLGLDRALVATVKEVGESGGLELALGLYDVRGGRKLSGRKVSFQGDEFGQLKSELAHVVNQLMSSAEGSTEKVVHSSDPLDSKHGTEEWSEERTRNSENKPKKKGDPLDSVSGTEDW